MKLKLNILGGSDLIKPNKSKVHLIDTRGNTISTVQTLSHSKTYDFQYDGVFIGEISYDCIPFHTIVSLLKR